MSGGGDFQIVSVNICPPKELEVPKEVVDVAGDDQDDEEAEKDVDKDADADGADGEGEGEKGLVC